MASKASLVLLILSILATSLLISLVSAHPRDLADNTEDKNAKNGEGLTDQKYPYGYGGGYPGGRYGGGYPGYGRGGYGGYPGTGYGRGGYGGYPGSGYGRGGYCRWGCCRRGYYGGCQCCMSANEIPEQEYRPEFGH